MARKSSRKKTATAKATKAPVVLPENPSTQAPTAPESQISQDLLQEAVDDSLEPSFTQIAPDFQTERSLTPEQEDGEDTGQEESTEPTIYTSFTSVDPPKSTRAKFKWTVTAIITMLDELAIQQSLGKVVQGSVKSESWAAVRSKLREVVGDGADALSSQSLKNKLADLKDDYVKWESIKKQSGWSFDNDSGQIQTSAENWEEYIEVSVDFALTRCTYPHLIYYRRIHGLKIGEIRNYLTGRVLKISIKAIMRMGNMPPTIFLYYAGERMIQTLKPANLHLFLIGLIPGSVQERILKAGMVPKFEKRRRRRQIR